MRNARGKISLLFGIIAFVGLLAGCSADRGACKSEKELYYQNDALALLWRKSESGWALSSFASRGGKSDIRIKNPSARYCVIYSPSKPDADNPVDILSEGRLLHFPESPIYDIRLKIYNQAISEVAMNIAGKAEYFYPSQAEIVDDNTLSFKGDTESGHMEAVWSFDDERPAEIKISLKFKAAKDGYYSLASPTVAGVPRADLKWGTVPGYFAGDKLNANFIQAYIYGQGLPAYPVICRERTITTMASIIEADNGITFAAVPAPEFCTNPIGADGKNTHSSSWKVGLSHMNREGVLAPTAYRPVLGQSGSYLKAGEEVSFAYTFSAKRETWYDAAKRVAYDTYGLKDFLALKSAKESLTNRLFNIASSLMDDKESYWVTFDYEGRTLGGQTYSKKTSPRGDVKNTDIGAAWMLGALSADPEVKERRLKYMRNFKIAQQQTQNGFFKGAVRGQYFILTQNHFMEEFGHHYEPIGLTYYTIIDLADILLFDPADAEVKQLLKNGAQKLLEWQLPDGSWQVAYDKETHKPIYTDIRDLRPTFYGMLVAYKMLGDEKYLKAAQKGADWFVENAVRHGSFLGVCGDFRFANDFATGQSAQALLDMYEVTKEQKYLDAAIAAAKIYAMSIYTHPAATREEKKVNGQTWQDWQLSRIGLSFEHGGAWGSANTAGPTLLSSHAGMFVRFYELTNDEFFLDLARAGALGRDAFIDPKTHIASYYWTNFNRGASQFPNHGWWQIGWIMDYLAAEAELRSAGEIKFERGFVTPKVGPHKALGFKAGTVCGVQANLLLKRGLIQTDNPDVDYLTALSADGKTLFVILLNDSANYAELLMKVSPDKIGWGGFKSEDLEFADFATQTSLPAWGIKIVKLEK